MSRSKRVFQLVQPHIPDTIVCDGILVVGRTDYILRGFLLDTTPHKDRMRLWRIVLPLFQPRSHLVLTYSDIIAPRYHGAIPVDRKDYASAAVLAREEIQDHVESLRALVRPSHFFERITRLQSNMNPSIQFDIGITHYLMGNTDAAIAIFNRIESSRLPELSYFDALIPLVLSQLKTQPALLQDAIDKWRLQTVRLLKLDPACGMRGKLKLV